MGMRISREKETLSHANTLVTCAARRQVDPFVVELFQRDNTRYTSSGLLVWLTILMIIDTRVLCDIDRITRVIVGR